MGLCKELDNRLRKMDLGSGCQKQLVERIMKFFYLLLFSACVATGQSQAPFEEAEAQERKSDEMVYDFADVHKWDDVIVKGIGKVDEGILTWGATRVASHRGVAGKTQQFEFTLDTKKYKEALGHHDLNRGVILMAGDPRFPSLQCWLRPFSAYDGKVCFVLSVPVDRLGETYVAFIPRDGKKRYLYKLAGVVSALKNPPETPKDK